MDFEKYCENLTDKLTDIMQHKAPTLLRNAELCVNPHYLDHERHHITFYGYFKIEDKNYQFFHLRVDIRKQRSLYSEIGCQSPSETAWYRQLYYQSAG